MYSHTQTSCHKDRLQTNCSLYCIHLNVESYLHPRKIKIVYIFFCFSRERTGLVTFTLLSTLPRLFKTICPLKLRRIIRQLVFLHPNLLYDILKKQYSRKYVRVLKKCSMYFLRYSRWKTGYTIEKLKRPLNIIHVTTVHSETCMGTT